MPKKKKKTHNDHRITPTTYDKLKFPALITAVIMLLVSFFGVLLIGALTMKIAKKPNAYKAANEYSRVSFYSKNFLTLWLTGGPNSTKQIKQMYDGELPEIATNPASVQDLNVSNATMTPLKTKSKKGSQPDKQWNVDIGATISALGSQDTQRMFYRVSIYEHEGEFKVAKLPEPVNPTGAAFSYDQSQPFPGEVGLKSTAGVAVQNFVKAYYTKNDSGSLGRYVTSNFDASDAREPMRSTIYTGAEVTHIQSEKRDGLDNAKKGAQENVLITVKLSTSASSFVYSQTYVTLEGTDNGQWLVDSVNTELPEGKLSQKSKSQGGSKSNSGGSNNSGLIGGTGSTGGAENGANSGSSGAPSASMSTMPQPSAQRATQAPSSAVEP